MEKVGDSNSDNDEDSNKSSSTYFKTLLSMNTFDNMDHQQVSKQAHYTEKFARIT